MSYQNTVITPIASLYKVQFQFEESDNILFNDLTVNFEPEKIGLIGNNGLGKTTLLKLISGELIPNSGTVSRSANIACLPQNIKKLDCLSVAETLGIQDKLSALKAIHDGTTEQHHFDIIGDNWTIAEETKELLNSHSLGHLDLDRKLNTLSGGEVTRLLLLNILKQNPDCLLLDEPTNNLDKNQKMWLYKFISEWNQSAIIISHDRELLTYMDSIMHITPSGIKRYGGNYTDFTYAYSNEQAALSQKLQEAKKLINNNKRSIQNEREKREKRAKQGKIVQRKKNGKSVAINGRKEQSENTQHKKKIVENRLLNTANKQYEEVSKKIDRISPLSINLEKTYIPTKKQVIEMKNIYFKYPDSDKNIIHNFSFTLSGSNRIAVCGNNGSGKSTLIKLIIGNLKNNEGTIKIGIKTIAYLDQHATILDSEKTILDNFQDFNTEMPISDCYFSLAEFGFRNTQACQLVKTLSGGKKLLAALACQLMQSQAPQLIILDEPTNHLDLHTIAHIERALLTYKGAVLVTSHDDVFLKNIKVDYKISAPFDEKVVIQSFSQAI